MSDDIAKALKMVFKQDEVFCLKFRGAGVIRGLITACAFVPLKREHPSAEKTW